MILLDAGDRVVPAFSEKLSAKAARYLGELGVTVREGARATAIDERGVNVEVAGRTERIASRTVIWAAGVRAAPLTETLAKATGASTDRAGRIEVAPDLTVAGHPEISAIGDMTSVEGPGGKPLPGLATVAIQQARHVAKAIRDGRPGASTPFRYFDKGALAVVGTGRAVCEVRGLKLSGRIAFLTYLGVHLYYLGGGAGPAPEGPHRLDHRPDRPPPEPGHRGRARHHRAGARACGVHPVGADSLLPLAADLEAARSQMALTLGFHIILASLGVAFPAHDADRQLHRAAQERLRRARAGASAGRR